MIRPTEAQRVVHELLKGAWEDHSHATGEAERKLYQDLVDAKPGSAKHKAAFRAAAESMGMVEVEVRTGDEPEEGVEVDIFEGDEPIPCKSCGTSDVVADSLCANGFVSWSVTCRRCCDSNLTVCVGDLPTLFDGVGPTRRAAVDDWNRKNCTPRLSQSIAWEMLSKSPRHAQRKHRLLGGERGASTAAMDHGTLTHELVLGGDKIAILDFPDWRTKKAKEAREEARRNGLVPVLRHQVEKASATANAVIQALATPHPSLDFPGLFLADGDCERRLSWEIDGIPCEGTPDWFGIDVERQPTVLDLKWTGSAADEETIRGRMHSGWALQRSAYLSALDVLYPELAGRWRWYWCVVEGDTNEVALYRAGASVEQIGHLQWRRALCQWRGLLDLHDTNPNILWPGYGLRVIEASDWQIRREEDRQP